MVPSTTSVHARPMEQSTVPHVRPPVVRVLGLVAAFVAVVSMASVAAATTVTDDSDDATWVTEPVPGTRFTVGRPARWVVNPSYLEKELDDAPGDIHLVIANPDNGDS